MFILFWFIKRNLSDNETGRFFKTSDFKTKKDMGTLEINFANQPAHLYIYALENSENPLYSTKKTGKNVSVNLGYGSYFVLPYSDKSGGLYNKLGFQINQGKQNVKIKYDKCNKGCFK